MRYLPAIPARACAALGFDEININVGCPSKVVSGCNCYGAALMKEPTLVQQLAAAVRDVVPSTTAVTVKHRLGVDEHDSWEQLREFVELVSAPPASVRHFIVHARKAILGLTTVGNRDIPPLRHEWVWKLAVEFPHLSFELNGGVANLDQAGALLAGRAPEPEPEPGEIQLAHFARDDTNSTVEHSDGLLSGVMIGRAAFHSPWMFSNADATIFGDSNAEAPTRQDVVEEYVKYGEAVWEASRLRLEAEVREEMAIEGQYDPAPHALAHRLKPRLGSIREALYRPLMNLFAEPRKHGQTSEAGLTDHESKPAREYRKRLVKSLGKQASLRKAAEYALRAYDRTSRR